MVRYRDAVWVGLAAAALVPFGMGQGRVLSPPMTVNATIGGKTLRVDYGAPSMRGRKVMGGLVPYGEVWCAGANDATTLTTDADLEVAGLKVPKGSYTLWAIPGKTEWTLIVNRQTGQWHTEYDESRDLGRVKIQVKTLAKPVERFRIELKPSSSNQGTLSLIWETTEAWAPITILR